VEVEGSGDTPKRGQQALLDYVLRVGVDGKPPLYVDGTKQTFPARRQQRINQTVATRPATAESLPPRHRRDLAPY
jgi:hypothetical protein